MDKFYLLNKCYEVIDYINKSGIDFALSTRVYVIDAAHRKLRAFDFETNGNGNRIIVELKFLWLLRASV